MNGELMAAEMGEQPGVLGRLVERQHEVAAEIRGVRPDRLDGITLVARGSSDNAAIYGRYILEMAARRPAGLTAPSIHTLYQAPVDLAGYVAVGISQSGRTPEIVTVLGRLRDQGARTVAIVNDRRTPLSEVAEVTIELGAGEERAVPATKSFTATLAALALVAAGLGEVSWREAELRALPAQVAALLDDPGCAHRVAADLDGADRLLATGRGLLLVAALETALKVRETSGILAEGISPADLRHGPIAAVGEGFPVLAFSPGAGVRTPMPPTWPWPSAGVAPGWSRWARCPGRIARSPPGCRPRFCPCSPWFGVSSSPQRWRCAATSIPTALPASPRSP